ncbi:MAG: thiamine pyrophosphate-dependent dehydrogenase E1 component subunit alpha [Patescibacteria group bacterium]|nr:thiamine pyrophosphate-dependent dehydrogenase E1 component subunit alpha [Patescibacteria group bacterium]
MDLLGAYRKMFLIRAAEEELAALYLREKIMSFVHFYVGQEAIAVGVCDQLKEEDRVMGNHRSHGHYLARGGDLKAMVCELLGKEGGSSKGKGGSMHMIDKSVGFVGSTPILGSVTPLAAGTAFERKYNNTGGVSVVFIGDGASEEGVVYETMNLAGLYKLPLLIVIENNLYSVNTTLSERRTAGYDVQKVVEGIGLNYRRADGNDYHDVAAKAGELIDGVRAGTPAVLECITYRHMAHSAPIMDESVRKEDTLDVRKEKDALKRVRDELIAQGDQAGIEAAESQIKAHVLDAISFAQAAPYPAKESLYTHLYE